MTAPAEGPPPQPARIDTSVVENEPEGGTHRRIRLRAPGWPGSQPGQFVMLSAGARSDVERTDPLLPRPMAIYRSIPHPDASEIDVLYKVSGRGTALLAETLPGQSVRMVGPLGRPFPPPESERRAILVGGGTGVASLYDLAARECSARAAEKRAVTVLLGARSEEEVMGRGDFARLDVDFQLATEDGSTGHRGLVTEPLERILAAETRDVTLYVCGPTPMMRRCAELAEKYGARCIVSLENNMACGFGVCLGCAAPRRQGGYALVCREGPVFEASAVDWAGLP